MNSETRGGQSPPSRTSNPSESFKSNTEKTASKVTPDQNVEEWQPIPTFPGYALSSLDRVYSWKTGVYKRVFTNHCGELAVSLFQKGNGQSVVLLRRIKNGMAKTETENTKHLLCPYCGCRCATQRWWADFVETQGGGRQQCESCGQWFGNYIFNSP